MMHARLIGPRSVHSKDKALANQCATQAEIKNRSTTGIQRDDISTGALRGGIFPADLEHVDRGHPAAGLCPLLEVLAPSVPALHHEGVQLDGNRDAASLWHICGLHILLLRSQEQVRSCTLPVAAGEICMLPCTTDQVVEDSGAIPLVGAAEIEATPAVKLVTPRSLHGWGRRKRQRDPENPAQEDEAQQGLQVNDGDAAPCHMQQSLAEIVLRCGERIQEHPEGLSAEIQLDRLLGLYLRLHRKEAGPKSQERNPGGLEAHAPTDHDHGGGQHRSTTTP
eukprot:CAMPEP_0115233442 /NCGR_PEP_ID=MMETSP0270-20121206/34279_1 /TAXON_ID=71861 /ORGANISM="Scrippsiella trochoidea, Strain CCMP3099" /LENGTH=279 /DNA_ID=CAMNT_0002648157 /DNA_START=544 /DNA_END=1380 /DNA_ORIENTATION=+